MNHTQLKSVIMVKLFLLVLTVTALKSASSSTLQNRNGHHDVEEVNAEMPMAPVFTRQDKMHRIIAKPAGNMLRLKCPAEGNPSPNITWFKNDVTPERHLGTFRYGRWSIMLEDLVTTDSGNYTCLVCNTQGCTNFTFKVDILERCHQPLIFIKAPQNTTVVVGDVALLRCSVLSDLHVHIEWRRGHISNLERNITTPCSKRLEADASVEFSLFNVTINDAGWYTCYAFSCNGLSTASAYVNVVESIELNAETTEL